MRVINVTCDYIIEELSNMSSVSSRKVVTRYFKILELHNKKLYYRDVWVKIYMPIRFP